MQQAFGFTLGEFVYGDTCPRRHHSGNIFVAYLVIHHALFRALRGFRFRNGRFDTGDHFIVQFGGVLVVAFAHGSI